MATVSLLATVGDLAASQTAGGISALLPSGIILPYGGATPPTGWLFCNGQAVSRTTYAALFTAVGVAHGSGDGSLTFNLPDLRGRFLRGTDTMSQNAVTTAAGRDPNSGARTAANSGGSTGDNVGSVQTNATAKNGISAAASSVSGSATTGGVAHTHTYTYSRADGFLYGGGGYGNVRNAEQSATTSSASATDHTHGLSATAAAQTITGDAETRPLNANVNYIIKL